jgi:hypothetical protein
MVQASFVPPRASSAPAAARAATTVAQEASVHAAGSPNGPDSGAGTLRGGLRTSHTVQEMAVAAATPELTEEHENV